MAQIALRRTDDRTKALGDTVSELLGMDEPRKRFAGMMSGLDIRYDLSTGGACFDPLTRRRRRGRARPKRDSGEGRNP